MVSFFYLFGMPTINHWKKDETGGFLLADTVRMLHITILQQGSLAKW